MIVIVCGCKTGCGKACGCRKKGIEYLTACTHCHGRNYTNSYPVNEENYENPNFAQNGLNKENITDITPQKPVFSESEDEIYNAADDFFFENDSQFDSSSDV